MNDITKNALYVVGGVAAYRAGSPVLAKIVAFVLISYAIAVPFDWCYSAITGERVIWTDKPPAFHDSETESNELVVNTSLWGSTTKEWVDSGHFKKAIPKYSTLDVYGVDEEKINSCVSGNMRDCHRIRQAWMSVTKF